MTHRLLKRIAMRLRTMRLRMIILLLTLMLTAMAGVVCAYYLWWREAVIVSPDPAAYPVRGIDISAHNGVVDFDKVASVGMDFVILKATEGATFKDKNFPTNYRKARKAGLKVGAYHFFRFDVGGYMQALNLMHSIKGRRLELPVVIDVEEWSNPRDHTTHDILARLQTMINTLEAHGYHVMLYSNKDGFEKFFSQQFAHYPLWLCSFTGAPEAGNMRLWQFSHVGRVSGVDGKVDINTFNGSAAAWQQWLDELD